VGRQRQFQREIDNNVHFLATERLDMFCAIISVSLAGPRLELSGQKIIGDGHFPIIAW
jgi:hypothetical protein